MIFLNWFLSAIHCKNGKIYDGECFFLTNDEITGEHLWSSCYELDGNVLKIDSQEKIDFIKSKLLY